MILRNRVLVCVVFLVAALAASPYFLLDYGVHNDYRALDYVISFSDISSFRSLMWHDESMHLLYIGRPVNAILFNLQQLSIKDLNDLKVWRVISFVTVIVAYVISASVSVRLAKKRFQWVVFSYFLFFLLPSTQLYISWVANYVPGSLNLFLASLASLAFLAFLKSEEKNFKSYSWFLLSLAILLIANMNYTANVCFFILPFIVGAVFETSESNVNYVKSSIIGMLVGVFLYILIYKLFLFPLLGEYFGEKFVSYDPATYKFALSLNVDVLKILYQTLVAWFSSFFFSSGSVYGISFTFIVGLLGMTCRAILLEKTAVLGSSFRDRHQTVLWLVFFCFLVSIVPFIVTPHSFFAYRVFLVPLLILELLTVCCILYLSLIVRAYSKVKPEYIIFLMVFISGLNGIYQNYQYANQSATEYQFLVKKLKSYHPESQDYRVGIVLPDRFVNFNQTSLSYDLTYTATNYSGLMKSVVFFAAKELGIPRNNVNIFAINSFYVNGFKLKKDSFDEDTLIVDMNEISSKK